MIAIATRAIRLRYVNVPKQHVEHLSECYMPNILQLKKKKKTCKAGIFTVLYGGGAPKTEKFFFLQAIPEAASD